MRSGRFALFLGVALVSVSACDKGSSNSTRPEACAYQAAIPGDPRRMPSGTTTRCSYDDAMGHGMADLRGIVVGEEEKAPGTPLGNMWVGVFDVEDERAVTESGPPLAKGVTDPSGTFHLSAYLAPGTYLLVARAEPAGETLAIRQVVVDEAVARKIHGITLIVPLDPALRHDDVPDRVDEPAADTDEDAGENSDDDESEPEKPEKPETQDTEAETPPAKLPRVGPKPPKKPAG